MLYTFTLESVSEVYPNKIDQIELWNNYSKYDNDVNILSKYLDEKVAKLYPDKLRIELEQLNEDQANYKGISVDYPY